MRPTGKDEKRSLRHNRLRARVEGTAGRPRLAVYRSLRHVYAQIIDDSAGRTLVFVSSLSKEVREGLLHGGNKAAAEKVGQVVARKAADAGIKQVCFDRGGFKYHGVVAVLAEAARKAGLEF
jgi:large subunit ribosomal protein L18